MTVMTRDDAPRRNAKGYLMQKSGLADWHALSLLNPRPAKPILGKAAARAIDDDPIR